MTLPASLPQVPPRRRGQRRAVPGRVTERGSTTLELVVLFPVVLLLIFGVIQGALFFHGRASLLAAAEQGVRAGRSDGASDPAAVAAQQARQFLTDTGELDNLTELTIVPAVGEGQVRLTITGRTVSLLPGVPGPQVSQTASGSLERFTTRAAP